MKPRIPFLVLSTCVLTILAASPPAAPASPPTSPPLFLVDSTFDDSVTTIHTVDPLTGELVLRADLGTTFTPILGLAAASDSVLFVAASDHSKSPRRRIRAVAVF